MAATSELRSGLPDVDYYAPNFRVEVEGQELSPTTKGDVLQVSVTMQENALTSFNLSINNWDDERLQFKYTDTDTFFIGKRIHVFMGYADKLVSMIQGQVHKWSAKFPQSGSPTLEVEGLDLLSRLKGSKPHDGDALTFTGPYSKIAQTIAARHGLDIEVTDSVTANDAVIQKKDQDDASFLLDLARRIDFDLFMQVDPDTKKDKLHFVRPSDGRDSRPIRVYQFEWGKTLCSFTPVLNNADQIGAVTVRGYDSRTKSAIVATVTAADLPTADGSGPTGPQLSEKNSTRPDGKQDYVVNSAIRDQEEARKLAFSRLMERANSFNTGSGEVIGLPDLRVNDNVDLSGLGTRFSGRYRVTKVVHAIGSSGFRTQFEVERNSVGKAK